MEIDTSDNYSPLETFYVYRSLHSDESWNAILIDSTVRNLPNITYGMRVYAANKKEAIDRARRLYDKLHAHDNDKINIREFMSAALRSMTRYLYSLKEVTPEKISEIAKISMNLATESNREYNEYFDSINEDSDGV